MQISLGTEILEKLYTHATTARRLAGYIDAANVIEPLGKSIGEIVDVLAEILDKPQAPRQDDEVTREITPEFNVAIAVDGLRQLIAKTDAFATAARDVLDEVQTDGDSARRGERLAHLVGATAEAALAAVEAGDTLADDLATHRTGA